MKKSTLLYLLLMLFFVSCQQQPPQKASIAEDQTKEKNDKQKVHDQQPASKDIEKPSEETSVAPQSFTDPGPPPIPDRFKLISEAIGDLDKDEIPEKVAVFETPEIDDLGAFRELHIFKIKDDQWQLWHTAKGPVMQSESGGMMGDPFDGVTIERGAIVLKHFGGSREKWGDTHRFRLNESTWNLIGVTVSFGAPCDQWSDFDYNLSTGKIFYKKETQNCEDGEENMKIEIERDTFLRKLEVLPVMDGFEAGSNPVKLRESLNLYY